MNLGRLRLLTFDVTDTLLKFRTAPGKQYGEIAAMYGILVDSSTLTANFKAHWQKMIKEHPNFGLDSGLGWEGWWKQIIVGTFRDAKYNLDSKKLDAISSHLIDTYKTSSCWQHCYGVLDLLSYLKHKGLVLGVVSNFDPRLNKTLENTKLRHYFKFIATSYEVGIEKPDPRIFEEAMKLSKLEDLKPEECLHVGDTPALDYKGAKSAGWHAALIHDKNPDKIQKMYQFLDSDSIFPSLYDLHKYLLDTNGAQLSVHSKN